MWPFKKRSDEELIKALRRNLAIYDRWRPWLKGLYLFAFVTYLTAVIGVAIAFESGAVKIPNFTLGLFAGLAVGASLGLTGYHIFQGFFEHWLLSYRNERLLLHYHDELTTLQKVIDESNAEDSDLTT